MLQAVDVYERVFRNIYSLSVLGRVMGWGRLLGWDSTLLCDDVLFCMVWR